MFDIGMGEFLVIAIIAVLILGPDRLPKAVAEATRWIRALRDQAANARREISAAADLDPSITDDLRKTMSDLSDLHPRRLASSILADVNPMAAATPTPATPSAAPVATPARTRAPSPAEATAASPAPASPTPAPASPAFDPDAT